MNRVKLKVRVGASLSEQGKIESLQLGEEKVSHEFACFGAVVASHCYVECRVTFSFARVGDCELGWRF